MQILLIFSFVIAFFAILFAIQNTTVTPVRFLIWETEGSLALILFIALVAGALISYLATMPTQIRQRMKISNQRKELAELESQLNSSKQELEQADEKLKQVEEKELEDNEEPSSDEESNGE